MKGNAIGIAGLILNHIGGPHPDCKVHPANRPDRACPECEVLAGAEIIARVRAKAWAEGYEKACDDHGGYASCGLPGAHGHRRVNPYREAGEQS